MLKFLKRLFSGPPIPSLDHPVFGRLALDGGERGPYWMHDSYSDDDLSISIETVGEEPPSEAQIRFFKAVTGNWDAMFERVSADVVAKYQGYVRKPFPQHWRSALRPGGIGVPLAGDENNPWDVAFVCETDNLGFVFTCWFEGGKLNGVTVDT